MELKATDLRVGNILNYDTSEGDTVTAVIDWQDIKWISEDPKGFNLVHSPIQLTEEWLEKFGGKKISQLDWVIKVGGIEFYCRYNKFWYSSIGNIYLSDRIQFVHQLQNIYHALTGQEL